MGCKKCYSGAASVLTFFGFTLLLVAYILFLVEYNSFSPMANVEVPVFDASHKLMVMLIAATMLSLICFLLWLPFGLLDNGACCLGTVKETALKATIKAKDKVIKGALLGVSLVTFALVTSYTVFEFVAIKEENVLLLDAMMVPCVVTAIASAMFLLNVPVAVLYYRA